MCFLVHVDYLFVISFVLNSVCVKCSNKKKGTRSATTNFGKEEVLIIQEGGRGLGKELILQYCIDLLEKSASPLCPSPFSAPWVPDLLTDGLTD